MGTGIIQTFSISKIVSISDLKNSMLKFWGFFIKERAINQEIEPSLGGNTFGQVSMFIKKAG